MKSQGRFTKRLSKIKKKILGKSGKLSMQTHDGLNLQFMRSIFNRFTRTSYKKFNLQV